MNSSPSDANAESENQQSEEPPHVIRIRGPWQRTVLNDGAQDVSADDREVANVKMPGSWSADLGEDFQGTVRYQRMFNRPTGITQETTLRLVFQQIVGDADVHLNDELLGTILWPNQTGSFDVTDRMNPRNQIRVDIQALRSGKAGADQAPPPGGMVGEVQLQIR